jgi:predicted amino acid racemase
MSEIDELAKKTAFMLRTRSSDQEKQLFFETYERVKKWRELDDTKGLKLINDLCANFHVYKNSIDWTCEKEYQAIQAKNNLELFLQENHDIEKKMGYALNVHYYLNFFIK